MIDKLQDNLIYLHENNPELFKKIELYLEKANDEKLFKLKLEEGEIPNIIYNDLKKGKQTLYKEDNSDVEEWFQNYTYLSEGTYDIVIYGLGLTYHLAKLMELNDQLNFYIIEPELDIFVESLKVLDIDLLLEHPQVKLFKLGNSQEDFGEFTYLLNVYGKNPRVSLFIPFYLDISDSIMSYYKLEYRDLTAEIFTRGFENNFKTLPYRNTISNIANFYRSHSLLLLKDKFRNCTALIVGAGPSLELDIDLIKRLKKKLLIIAAGSSIQSLLHFGIEPHLIVSMDPSEANGEVFKKTNTSNVPLVFIDQIYSEILKYHPYNNFHAFFNSDCITNYFFEDNKLEPKFLPTLSVSGTAIQVAYFLGAKNILLAGQDLSFPNKQYYSNGAKHLSQRTLNHHINTNSLMVENVNGGLNNSNFSMKATLEDIEELIGRLNNIKFINTSSLGATIKGAQYIRLKEVESLLDIQEFEFETIKQIARNNNYKNSFDLHQLLLRVDETIQTCEYLVGQCELVQKLISNIDRYCRKNPEKSMGLLIKLENEFSKVTESDLFKKIIPSWNFSLTRTYDKQVIEIEDEVTITGKSKLLNKIVVPYINNIIKSFVEIRDEFIQLQHELNREG